MEELVVKAKNGDKESFTILIKSIEKELYTLSNQVPFDDRII